MSTNRNKFAMVQHCLANSGLSLTFGQEQLFFKADEGSEVSSCQQSSGSFHSSMFTDDDSKFCKVIDFKTKTHYEVELNHILDRSEAPSEPYCLLAGEMLDTDAMALLNVVSGSHSRYNGLIFWELQMVQDYDKILKFDDNVCYHNVSVHNHCSHYDHLFWVKMVQFGENCLIFFNSNPNFREISKVIIENYGLKEHEASLKPQEISDGNEQIEKAQNQHLLLFSGEVFAFSDILFSILNHAFLLLIPSTNLLILQTKHVRQETYEISLVERKTYIECTFRLQDKLTHFHNDMERKKKFLTDLIEKLDNRREHQDQRIQCEHLIGRIRHQDYLVQLAIEMNQKSFCYLEIENKQFRMFNIMALFFTPPTLVSGIYGMNVNVPWENNNHPDEVPPYITSSWGKFKWALNQCAAFWLICFVAITVTALVMCLMRRKKYI